MLFPDNTWWHTYAEIYKHTTILSQPSPLLPALPSFCSLLYDSTPLFTYLENQLLLLVMRVPIHSCPWLAINCSPLAASPTPRHPTDQITYLHRRHQQHQPSCLTQKTCNYSSLNFAGFQQCLNILRSVWNYRQEPHGIPGKLYKKIGKFHTFSCFQSSK
jgi:hypothetical protein